MSNGTVPVYEIPKTCKAAVVVNEGPDFHVEVQDVPVPEIGPEDVLIKINATGLCSSDIHFMQADMAMAKMSNFGTRCAGHEGAGVIVKVGERVKNLKVGMRAGFKPIADVCGMCEQCRMGQETYCPKRVMTGMSTDGSYKQYLRSPERYTTIIPDGVSDYIAGPVMCSASTALASLKASGLRPGQWAVFPGGGGGVGIQGVQLAHAMGFRPVVIDTGDERRKLATELGAEAFVDFKTSENVVAEVIKICDGIGAHGVFVTAPQAYPNALAYLNFRPKGIVMCIGLPSAGKFDLVIPPGVLVLLGQSVRGTLVAGMGDVDEALQFAKRGKLRLEPTVVGLSQFNESVQKLKQGQVAGRIVVDFNKE